MLAFVVMSVAFAFEPLEVYTQTVSGSLIKMLSSFDRIYLPRYPLVFLSVFIELTDLDPPLDEYPTPKPVAYARFNAVPNEVAYDYQLDLKQHKSGYIIQESYPKYSEIVIVRIDGGLLDQLHLFCAYSVYGWSYKIKLKAYFCSSGLSTIVPSEFSRVSQLCNTTLQDLTDLPLGLSASMLYVPQSTSNLSINTNASYSISPYNFLPLNSNTPQLISNPLQGWWFFIVNMTEFSEFSIELEQCDLSRSEYCNGRKLIYVQDPEVHEELDGDYDISINSDASALRIITPVIMSDIKYRYALYITNPGSITNITYGSRGEDRGILCQNSKIYCKVTKEAIVAEIQYVEVGNLYIDIQSNNDEFYGVSVIKTKVGHHMCHDQSYYDFSDLVYYCFCLQNTAGFYCEKHAISNSEYLGGIMFLTLSNLAMVPALIYTYKIQAFVEFIGYLSNMIASYIYHFCDEQYYCFSISPYTLLVIDFILSYNSIFLSFIFLSKLTSLKVKFSILLSMLVILMYLGIGTNFSSFITSVLPLIIIGLFPLIRCAYFVSKGSKITYNRYFSWSYIKEFFLRLPNYRLRWLGIALGCFVAALMCRGFETNRNYYITHSFWHIFVMSSAFCVIRSVITVDKGFVILNSEEGSFVDHSMNSGLSLESLRLNP